MSLAPIYRRVILELGHGSSDPATLQSAAQFAALLGLDLHGLFVEDEALLDLAALPFAREIRLPTHEWGRMDADRLTQELRHQADAARHRLEEAVRALGVPNGFEVLRGDPAACLAARSCATDIVVFALPGAAGARASLVLGRLHEAAEAAEAAVLLLPPTAARSHGSVVAVLADEQDAGLETAARIAAAARERLTIIVPAGTDIVRSARQRAHVAGLPDQLVAVKPVPGLQADDVLHALAGEHERLIVMTRGAEPAAGIEAVSHIMTVRRVPVLLVEPPKASANAR